MFRIRQIIRFLSFSVGFFLCLLSCKKEVIPKPENLIPKDKMEAILYELAILNGAKGIGNKKVEEQWSTSEDYLYEKYAIDSTLFAASSMYYAAKPEIYITIHSNVEQRLLLLKKEMEALKKATDSIGQLQKTHKDSIPLARKEKKELKFVN